MVSSLVGEMGSVPYYSSAGHPPLCVWSGFGADAKRYVFLYNQHLSQQRATASDADSGDEVVAGKRAGVVQKGCAQSCGIQSRGI